MISSNRPLSPHLQVYRLPMLANLSILHRITGVALGFGALLLTYWLVAAASGPAAFATAQDIIGSFFGRLFLFGWTFALFYHLFNGIRHMLWDTGWGFELPVAFATGMVVAGSAVTVTVIVWVVAATAMWG